MIGIGLNVRIPEAELPRDLRWPATSVGHGATVPAALRAVNARLEQWVAAPPERVLAAYRERDALHGRPVGWEAAGEGGTGEGVAAGIDERGNLLVDAPTGERLSLGAGEVQLRVGRPWPGR